MLSSIGSFLGSSFTLGSIINASGELVANSVSGAQILEVASTITNILFFASDQRPKNNKVQNKQFWDAARKAGYNVNDPNVWDELNEIHQYIRQNNVGKNCLN